MVESDSPPIPKAPRPSPWTYARTLKDPAVEELIDLVLHRPIAFAVLRPWEHATWRPTPNQFTLAGGALGILAAVVAAMAPAASPWWVVSALLLFSSNILDCCDGMLARLTGQASSRGMLLDGMIDFIVGVMFWLVVSLRMAPDWGFWTVPAALSIILSILIHTGLYDHMRIRFNVLVQPPPAVEPEQPRAVPPEPQPCPPEQGLWARFLDGFFAFAQGFYEITYTNISRLAIGVEPSSPRPDVAPAVARQVFSGPMRMASFLGLGTHLFLMYCATILAMWDGTFEFAFWVVVGGLNVWTVFVVAAWRRAEAIVAELGEHTQESSVTTNA